MTIAVNMLATCGEGEGWDGFLPCILVHLIAAFHQVSMAMMWLATESSIPLLPMLYVMRNTFTSGSFSSLSTGSVSSHHLFSCSVYSSNLLQQCLFTELPLQCVYSPNPWYSVYSPNQSLFTYTKPPLAARCYKV